MQAEYWDKETPNTGAPWPRSWLPRRIAIATGLGLAAAVAGTVRAAFDQWIPSEERDLTRTFGDQYRAYLARTRRWL